LVAIAATTTLTFATSCGFKKYCRPSWCSFRRKSALLVRQITKLGEAFQAKIVNYADDSVILSRGFAAEAPNWTWQVMAGIGLTRPYGQKRSLRIALKTQGLPVWDSASMVTTPPCGTEDGYLREARRSEDQTSAVWCIPVFPS
jgi:hypothetical protein